MALALSVGALCALLWANLVQLPAYEVRSDGHAVIDEHGLTSMIAADAAFVVLGLLAGFLLGGFAWYRFRELGWPVAFIAVGSALLAGVTCWWLGSLVGPGPFAERLAAAEAGDVVPVALEVRSPSALAVWAFAAAAVPLFAASLGPEARRAPRPPRRRRGLRPAVDPR